jgi:signal recognition particle subunit SRP9
MYIENIDSFLQQAEELYLANPLLARYVVKYRHCDGKLIVKVTDDVTCLKYKTTQQADLKKIEKLNDRFFHLMATGEAPVEKDVEMIDSKRQQQKTTRRKG